MKFKVTATANPDLVPIGKILTPTEVAQLVEVNVNELEDRSFAAANFRFEGFSFDIVREV